MTPALIGTKLGMTRVFDEKGRVLPVTVIDAGPCTVLQIRSRERDGYDAVQMGFLDIKPHRSTKPLIGHAACAGVGPKRHAREIRLDGPCDANLGDVLTVEVFADGVKHVDIAATSKGRGFQGVMRRHGFGGQQATHGVERKHRSAGSIGGHTNIGLGRSIKKGKKMPGHWGCDRKTVCCLELVRIDSENGLLLVKGSVPGPPGGTVFIRQSKTKA